jgi:hypothetical protein
MIPQEILDHRWSLIRRFLRESRLLWLEALTESLKSSCLLARVSICLFRSRKRTNLYYLQHTGHVK